MNFAKQFLIYGAGGAASRLAAILLVPLYTRSLSIPDYGQLEVLLALYAVTVLLAGLQSESAVARDYFEAKAEGNLDRLQWGGLAITIVGTVLLALAAAIAAALGVLPEGTAGFIPWLLAMTLPAQLLGIQLVVIRFAGTPVFFAFLSFLDLSLAAVSSVLFIVVLDWGITGALAGIALSKTVCATIAWRRTFRLPAVPAPPISMIRAMLAYALPTMPSVLLNWLQTNGTRVLLVLFLTLTDVAVAGIAIKMAALYGFLTYSFRLAWEPYAFESLGILKHDPSVYNRALQWYVLVMFLAAGLATIASPLLVSVLAPPAYGGAVKLAGIFIIGQFWVGAISILAIGIHGARITSRLTHVYGAGALVNVLFLAAFAEALGVTAAAIGFTASSMVSAVYAAYYSERHFRTGFNRRLIALALTASSLFALLCYSLYTGFDHLGASVEEHLLIYSVLFGALLLLIGAVVYFGYGPRRAGDMWRDMSNLVRARV